MLSVLSIFLLIHNVLGTARIDPLVETSVGLIRGVRAPGGNAAIFLGIPFGTVDTNNPFGPARPYPPFEGIFEANDDSSVCAQVSNGFFSGNLDCLHLDVHVPDSASSNNLLPVYVYVHGGGFETGSRNRNVYAPRFYVDQDIVVVSIDYRVGLYGFTCLDIPEVPGNQGLKDQVLAMRWVKQHIQSFGGNPNMITLGGESAGGAAVDYHLLTQDNLFDRVIIQCPITQHLSFVDPNPSLVVTLAGHLGFDANSTREALDFLNTLSPQVVATAAENNRMTPYRPCIERQFEGVENYVSSNPYHNLPEKIKEMPIIIGFNDNEMAFQQSNPEFLVRNSISALLRFAFFLSEEEFSELETIIHNFYMGDEELSPANLQDQVDFASDATFVHPITRSVRLYNEFGAKHVYQYFFTYVGGRNYLTYLQNLISPGAIHADELGYLFDMVFLPTPTGQDQVVLDRMTTMWCNFIKYGDPTPTTSELLPVKWSPVSEGSSNILRIDRELETISTPFHDRVAFWDLIWRLHGQSHRVNVMQ